MKIMVPIAMSNRHIHLSQKDLEILFGEGHELTKFKDLSQPGQYACEEKVDITGPKGTIKGVRILGPVRPETQLEVSVADSFALGVKPPVRDSGDIKDSPGVTLTGPKGQVEIPEGAIVASRHIHMLKNLDLMIKMRFRSRLTEKEDLSLTMCLLESVINMHWRCMSMLRKEMRQESKTDKWWRSFNLKSSLKALVKRAFFLPEIIFANIMVL
jgi:hypothetical protein